MIILKSENKRVEKAKSESKNLSIAENTTCDDFEVKITNKVRL